MCHAHDETPPAAPTAADSAGAPQELVLTSDDGTRFAAYHAPAPSPGGRGIVIVPDAGGLIDFYRLLADRFARLSVHAIAFDYYGRTAGLPPRGPDFKPGQHSARIRTEEIDADVRAAVERLRAYSGVDRVFSVGFCRGGAVAWRQAARGLAGGIGFYGSGQSLRETVPDLRSLRAPLLLLVAGQDVHYPIADSRLIDAELTAAGVVHETVIYPDAPHSFFRECEQWEAVCDDAWRRVQAFMA